MSSSPDSMIFIGMPIWNCEKTIRRAIESVLSQKHTNWILYISDNYSSDKTFEIAREYSKLDERIILFRQEENIGPERNFLHVLENSAGEFFKFHASDDWLGPDYLGECISRLDKFNEAVGVCTIDGWDWEYENGFQLNYFSLEGKQSERFSLLRKNCWRSNGLFYGVFRRKEFMEAAKFLKDECKFLNPDWIILARLIKLGDVLRTQKGDLVLGSKGASNSDPLYWWKQLHTTTQKLLPYRNFVTLISEGKQRITYRSRAEIYLWVFEMYVNHYKGLLSVLIRARPRYKK